MQWTNLTHRRKSDIENERLPPKLVDPDSNPVSDADTSPSDPPTPLTPDEVTHGALSCPTPVALDRGSPSNLGHVDMDSMNGLSEGFRHGHARQQSLGTTKTSPSTRRRSVENTISLIREAVEAETDEGSDQADVPS